MLQSSKGKIKNKVLYSKAVFGEEEKKAVADSLNNSWLAHGPKVTEFEEKIARLFGKKYGIAVNSGSSANLLALRALNLPQGSEVITPVCTFATTVAEIVNNNLVPVFVDSVLPRYTINEDEIEKTITNHTRAILVPQLLGAVCDMAKLKKIARKHKLYLVDDSCDTLAPTIGSKTVASFADVTTTSFYGSHIITALGMGGMVLTDNRKIRDRVINLRDWGRVGNDSEEFEARFNFSIDNIPYDSKFLYSEFGYNLKLNEAAGAFGLEQLKKLPLFKTIRQKNFNLLSSFIEEIDPHQVFFYLPSLLDKAQTTWLAFPLTISTSSPFKRYELLKHLESAGIQTRVLFSGNITRHPVYKNNNHSWRGHLSFPIADYIMANSFLIGCHQGMGEKEVNYIKKTFKEFLKPWLK